MDLTTLDIFVLLVVGALAVLGAVKGFVSEILSLLAWVAAIVALRIFYPAGKAIAANLTGSEIAAAGLGFVIIFFGTYFAFRLVATTLGRRTRNSIVGPIDRVLGFGFGAVKGLIVVTLVFLVLTRGFALIWGGDEKLPEFLVAAKTEPLLDVTSRAIIEYAEERQKGDGLGDNGEPETPAGEHGYSDAERDSLGDLLEDSSGTEI